jgi:hypothetical protein
VRVENESLIYGFFDGAQWEERGNVIDYAFACVGGGAGSSGCALSAEDFPPLLGLSKDHIFLFIVSIPAGGMRRVQKFA